MTSAARIVTKVLEPPAIAGRVPPHDLQAEVAVLATVMQRRDSLDEILDVLRPEDFYSDANRALFQACIEVSKAGTTIDAVSLAAWLRDHDRLATIGGAAYLGQLLDEPFSSSRSKLREWAEIVALKRRMREVVIACHETLEQAYGDHGEPKPWLVERAAAFERAAAIANTATASTHVGDISRAVWTEITGRLEGRGGGSITTGLADLDRLLNGLRPGAMMTIGARSHVGKSSLARQIAAHVAGVGPAARTAHGVLLWSGEQPSTECVEAMDFQLARVSEAKSRNKNRISDDDWRAFVEASSQLARSPLWIIDTPGITPMQLRAEVRKWKRDCAAGGVEPGLVVVDYVQLMSARGAVEKGANREREVAKISELLKTDIAMGERVALIVLAQLNKDGDKRKDSRPYPSDLRESGRLEQDSDKIVLIHNPHAAERMNAYRDGSNYSVPECETVELIVGKARQGGTMGTARVLFFPGHAQFADFDGREP